MNIFVLHLNPHIAAQMHCDQHVIKMIIESAQLLYTCIILNGIIGDKYHDRITTAPITKSVSKFLFFVSKSSILLSLSMM